MKCSHLMLLAMLSIVYFFVKGQQSVLHYLVLIASFDTYIHSHRHQYSKKSFPYQQNEDC